MLFCIRTGIVGRSLTMILSEEADRDCRGSMNKNLQPLTLIVVLILLATIGTSAARAVERSGSMDAFQQLVTLVGEWKGEKSGTEIKLIYTLTADGSALMEEFRPDKGPAMITMFTVDGDHLLATHYCSAGNQPNMATAPITDPQTKRIVFSLVRVTGLKTPDDWHNTGLTVILEDRNHLTQEWTYLYKGETGKTVFHFAR